MGCREFSPAFQDFVRKYVTSVEQIEVMLILYANPERSRTVHEISAILRTNEASIASRLDMLVRLGFARGKPGSGYRYAAAGELNAMVETLQVEYGLRRFSVIELVFSRSAGAQSLADAFLLREPDDRND